MDTLLGVYTGTSPGSLTPVASSDDNPGSQCFDSTDSSVTVPVTAGTTYRIAVDGKGGEEGSFNLKLTGPPANDSFGSPVPLGSGPTSISSNNSLATKQAGEPNHAGDPGGASVWYSWTPSSSGKIEVSTCTFSGLDTLLAVYTGSAVNALTPVASSDNSSSACAPTSSSLQFSYSAGTTYRIVVDGKGGGEGSFTLNLTGPAANDSFASPSVLPASGVSFLSGLNKLTTKEAGEPNHAGNAGGASVWYSWTPSASGKVKIEVCGFSNDTLLGLYTGTAVNALTPVASNDDGAAGFACNAGSSAVVASVAAGTTYRLAIDGKGGSEGSFSLNMRFAEANDAFELQKTIPAGLPASVSGSNSLASKEAGEPNHAGNAGGASVWFSWTPSATGPVGVTLCGSAPLDPLLGIYTGTGVNTLTPVAANDDAPAADCGGSASEVQFNATAGTTYRIAVDGKGGSEGSFDLDLSSRPANDDFAGAVPLGPGLPAFGNGGTSLATKQAGEPNHAGDAGGHSLWYSFTPASSGDVSISTCTENSKLDTLLAVYTGSAVNGLTQVAANDDATDEGCEDSDSELRFSAAAGTTYRIAVDGKGGTVGSFDLTVQGARENDDFTKAEALGPGLPSSTSGSTDLAGKQAGEPNHAGNAGGSSVWYSLTPSATGPIRIDVCAFSFDSLLAVYTGSAVNALTPVASNDDSAICGAESSSVQFNATAGTTYRFAVDGKDGGEGFFELDLYGPPANDAFGSSSTIGASLPAFASGSNRLATKQAGEPNHAGDAGGKSVWYSWTPAASGSVEISTCAFDGIDTLLAVYTGSAVNGLTPVASSDNALGGCTSTDSTVEFSAAAGTTYRIAVDGKGGTDGSFTLDLEGPPANDSFANAETLGPALPDTATGSNKLSSKQAGEPSHAGQSGGGSVWYSWTPASNTPAEITVCPAFSSTIDPLLAVYTGAAVNSLSQVAAAASAPGANCFSNPGSVVQFNAVAGMTYRIAVDGDAGTKGTFNLSLNGPPVNDGFSNAQSVGTLPAFPSGTNRLASKEAGEPSHAGNAGGHSVWYSVTPTSSGPIEVVAGCSFGNLDTLLGIYTGSAVNGLTTVASNDDSGGIGCGSTGSRVQFEAVAGTKYLIAIDGKNGAQGTFSLAVRGRPANDDFANAQVIPGSPPGFTSGTTQLASKQAGEPDHAGKGGGVSVWYSWTPTSSATVEISSCGFDTLLAVYTGSAVNALTPVASNDDGTGCEFGSGSSVQVAVSSGTTYRIAVDGKGGIQGSFELTFRGRPANDAFAAAANVGGSLPQEVFGTTKVASKEAGEPNHAGKVGGGSVWYSWTPDASGQVELSTCTFGIADTLLAVYTGSAVNALSQVAANDDGDGGCGQTNSSVQFAATAGTTYRVAVDTKGAGQGSFGLRFNGRPPNDAFGNSEALTGSLPIETENATTRLATKEAGEPNHAGDPGGGSVWYSWTPASSGQVLVTTCANFDTLLGIYTGTAVNALAPVAANDDSPLSNCETGNSGLMLSATAGTTYRIAVDGLAGESGSFDLRISGAPANDDFAGAELIGPALPDSTSGSNRAATKQAGEPNHGGNAGGGSVWYSWTPTASATMQVFTCASGGLNPLLSVYTGSSVNSLTPVASNDDSSVSCGSQNSRVEFDATAGTTYRIAVDGKNGSTGTFELTIRGAPANDKFADAQGLSGGFSNVFASGSNRLATKEAGEPNHAGNAGGHSVWYSLTPSASGPVRVNTCTFEEDDTLDTLLAVYTGSAVNGLSQVAADDSSGGCSPTDSDLEFNATAGTTYRIAVDGKNGAVGNFNLSLRTRPANDAFANAQAVTGALPRFVEATTAFATKEAGEPNHAGNPGGHSVWFSWTASSSGSIQIGTCTFENSDLDTLLAVYTGSAVNALTPVASDDDAGRCNDDDAQVEFTATAGTTYRIAVDSKGSATGAFDLSIMGRPGNDDFSAATPLSSYLPDFEEASNTLATKQAGEPNHAGNAGGASVWYSWTPVSSGEVRINTCGYGVGIDTLLAVYTGSAVNALTPVASNDDGPSNDCNETDSAVEFSATEGTTYWIAVDSKSGVTGSFELQLRGPPENDDFAHPKPMNGSLPALVFGTSRLSSKQAGEPNHAGDAGGGSVWFKWTAPLSGTVEVDACESNFDTLLAVYTGSAVNALTPVASNDNGGGTCSPGSKLTVSATAGTAYRIAVDGVGGAEGSVELAIQAPGSGTQQTLTVSKAGTGAGTVTSSPAGIDCGTTCSKAFDNATAVTLTATPAGGSTFSGWSGACTGTATCQVTMDQARSVTATFAPVQRTLTVAKEGAGTGTVASSPAGIDCGTTCSASFANGTQVTLTATPSSNSTFSGWSGACTGTGTCQVTMDQVRSVTASFAAVQRTLTVAKDGTGTGTVTSTPAGIDCGSTCSSPFANGTAVTLTATPGAGSTFSGWSGGGCSGSGTCQVTLNADSSVTATFTQNTGNQQTLTVSKAGTGAGTVTSNPAGIDCGTTCSKAFDNATAVTLTATPAGGSTFSGWSGACTGTATCQVTMDQARSVTATFDSPQRQLTVTKAGTGGGSVASNPAGIDCGTSCGKAFDNGTAVTLTATPVAGSTFAGWSGACTGTSTCQVTMDQARSVTATFDLTQRALAVAKGGTGAGTVTSSPAGIACGTTCGASYANGAQVTLTATPDASSTFSGWSGACTGTSTCQVTMDQARSVTATFTLKPTDGGGGGGGGGVVPPVVTPPAPPAPAPVTPKPLKCKKGFKKKSVKGKAKCVKVKKKKKK